MSEQNNINILVELSNKVGQLDEALKGLKLHFTNHVSQHKFDKIMQALYFGLTVAMFCLLRWWR